MLPGRRAAKELLISWGCIGISLILNIHRDGLHSVDALAFLENAGGPYSVVAVRIITALSKPASFSLLKNNAFHVESQGLCNPIPSLDLSPVAMAPAAIWSGPSPGSMPSLREDPEEPLRVCNSFRNMS